MASLVFPETTPHFENIEDVVSFANKNSSKSSAGTSYLETLDSELVNSIDSMCDFPVFVTDNMIFSREELMNAYQFSALKTTPEQVMTRQLFVLFSSGESTLVDEGSVADPKAMIAPSDFYRVRVLCKKRTTEVVNVKPLKVYYGREGWNSFQFIFKFASSVQKFLPLESAATLFKGILMLGAPETNTESTSTKKTDDK